MSEKRERDSRERDFESIIKGNDEGNGSPFVCDTSLSFEVMHPFTLILFSVEVSVELSSSNSSL